MPTKFSPPSLLEGRYGLILHFAQPPCAPYFACENNSTTSHCRPATIYSCGPVVVVYLWPMKNTLARRFLLRVETVVEYHEASRNKRLGDMAVGVAPEFADATPRFEEP